eukprot:TRINITY_DN6575_c0_g1_i5.p1 TRINITY_DN6575_c0_g1~~TRINITY_DN6575_c0_g1_i5.p1  ORF type:complete len:409 (+),score=155.03 TRINITY_DN6575_c0_g1_i5:122-1228(+)
MGTPVHATLQPRHHHAEQDVQLTQHHHITAIVSDVEDVREQEQPLQQQQQRPPLLSPARKQKAKVAFYFALWYALNIAYNIANKRALNALPLPWTVGTAQLGAGAVWVGAQWLLRIRAAPVLERGALRRVLPVAAFHGGGQVATVLSLGAGAVSFTHIVKAAEPLFSALVAAVAFGQVFKPQVYAALLPVVGGVAVACAKELNFSWVSFVAAMSSNLFFALRANYSKVLMQKRLGRNVEPANLYALITMVAFVLCLPLALAAEGALVGPAWGQGVKDLAGVVARPRAQLAWLVALSGLTHYLNNEVMYLALGSVHPVTLAVGNTLKRVFIIIASLVVFRNPITPAGAAGSAVAIAGVQLYSWARQRYP